MLVEVVQTDNENNKFTKFSKKTIKVFFASENGSRWQMAALLFVLEMDEEHSRKEKKDNVQKTHGPSPAFFHFFRHSSSLFFPPPSFIEFGQSRAAIQEAMKHAKKMM